MDATVSETPLVSLRDFQRFDLRMGEVVAAEAIVESDRLLRLEIDLAEEQRTIVAGLAEHHSPGSLLGAKVVVLANLEPAVIRGVRSEGMLLGVGCDAAPALLMAPDNVTNGSPVT